MGELVQISGLTKEFGSVRALNDLFLEVAASEWIAIMGPSGSGKTTLLNILGGLDSPTSGSVVVDGVDLARFDEARLTRYRAEKIGFVFQQFHLVPYLTAIENVMLAQYFHSMTDEQDAKRVLERVGLGDRLEHLPSQLSGGEQQRVAVARALINHPKLILADEPTGNLDQRNEASVIELFKELHDEGHTILLVTHDQAIGALADRRIELQHGRITQVSDQAGDLAAEFGAGASEEGVDHLLEEIWICGERGIAAGTESVHAQGVPDTSRAVSGLVQRGLIAVSDGQLNLTSTGEERARGVVRRHRLAERLFMDTFSIVGAEADAQACRFEHTITTELEEKICVFLGHPKLCPHGNPIPAGPCCMPPR